MNGPKHEQRDSDGHCRCETCGYDLHDNESGQCPECGAAGPGAERMPPQWRILIVALAVPMTLLLLWTVWSMVLKLRGS